MKNKLRKIKLLILSLTAMASFLSGAISFAQTGNSDFSDVVGLLILHQEAHYPGIYWRSDYDPGPEQLHTGEVVTFVPWDIFQEWKDTRWQKRGESYDTFKERMKKKLLEQFLKNMPELEPYLEYVELSTPLSTDHFVRPMAGSIYGIEPTPKRFRTQWLRPRSPIGNLFMAGSEVASVGVIGAMMGGVLSVLSAEPMGTIKMLRKAGMRT